MKTAQANEWKGGRCQVSGQPCIDCSLEVIMCPGKVKKAVWFVWPIIYRIFDLQVRIT